MEDSLITNGEEERSNVEKYWIFVVSEFAHPVISTVKSYKSNRCIRRILNNTNIVAHQILT